VADFLMRLAQRSAGVGEVVHARPRSLHAPESRARPREPGALERLAGPSPRAADAAARGGVTVARSDAAADPPPEADAAAAAGDPRDAGPEEPRAPGRSTVARRGAMTHRVDGAAQRSASFPQAGAEPGPEPTGGPAPEGAYAGPGPAPEPTGGPAAEGVTADAPAGVRAAPPTRRGRTLRASAAEQAFDERPAVAATGDAPGAAAPAEQPMPVGRRRPPASLGPLSEREPPRALGAGGEREPPASVAPGIAAAPATRLAGERLPTAPAAPTAPGELVSSDAPGPESSLAPSYGEWPAPPAAPVPDVHVAIGRIEVRLPTPPPAHPAQPGWSPPVLTLDEYLAKDAAR